MSLCPVWATEKDFVSKKKKKNSTKAQPIKAFTCKPDRPIFSLRATGRRKPSPKSCPLMSPCTPWLPSPSCIQTQNKGKPSKNKNDLEKSQERLFHFCRSSHFTFHDLYTVNAKYRKGCGSLTECLHGGGPGFSLQHLKIKTTKTLKMRT